jgi:nitrite reductase/ring-hydroxylating ferredoxin subunit
VTKLREIASVLRSKNADPFITTCDVFIDDQGRYDTLKSSDTLTVTSVAAAYGMPESAVLGIFFIDNVRAVKVSFLKYVDGAFVASGDLEDDDVSGMQRHAPLAEIELLAGPRDGAPVTVCREDEVRDGELGSFKAFGRPIVLTRLGGRIYAFQETCSHRRCSLARGEIEGRSVCCPCHGATFDIETGAVVRGPATTPIQTYDVSVADGLVTLRR